MDTSTTTSGLSTEQALLNRLAQEKRLAELVDVSLRAQQATKTALKTGGKTTAAAGATNADAKTLATIVTIFTTLVLAGFGLIFMYFYKSYRVAVLTVSCTYIALYGAFVMYVTNKVDEDECFKDSVLPLLLKGSTVLVLFVAIMITLATVLLPLIEPKKPDGPGGNNNGNKPQFDRDGNAVLQFNNDRDGDFGRRGKNRARNGRGDGGDNGYGNGRDNGFGNGRNDGFGRDNGNGRGRNDGFGRNDGNGRNGGPRNDNFRNNPPRNDGY